MTKKNVLSLFSCGGGMDIGFEGGFNVLKPSLNIDRNKHWIETENDLFYTLKHTTFHTLFANDINPDAKNTWVNYFNQLRDSETSDIYHVNSIVDLVKRHYNGESIFPNNIDVVTGGFPCQDFSIAGKRKGFNSHCSHNGIKDINTPTEETRGSLYIWMKEVIEITKPKIFIAENVKGLANLGNVKDIIQSDFSSIDDGGYIVLNPQILHAGRYGVPQSRERIFFIGFKKSALTLEAQKALTKKTIPEFYSPYPIPTHLLHREQGTINYSNYKFNPPLKLKDFLLDLKEPSHSHDLDQSSYSKAKYMGTHCQGQIEVDLNGLAPTIRSEHHGNIEFRRLSVSHGGKYEKELSQGMEERRLTIRECARIQTFPDNYNFVLSNNEGRKKYKVSPSSAYKLVGNAVPPLLAYNIAKTLEDKWELYFK